MDVRNSLTSLKQDIMAKAARQNNLFVYDLGTRVSFHSPWNLSRLIAKLSIC